MNKILKITSYIVLITFLFSQIAFADTIYFYHTDPAGTPIAMTDASGSVVWKADYKPFGEEWNITSNIENNKRFVGKEKDTETGLNYFGARYMLSNIGRFISTDPVGPVNPATGNINQIILNNPQRLNLYSYGLNNPYRYVDADGNIPLDTIWDLGNVIYDIATGDWESLGIDVACMMIPYVPAGVSKIGKVVKVAKAVDKAGDAAKVGKTVLGHYPEYLKVADELNAKKFNIPKEVWNKMSEADKWAANRKFLDRAISRGDEIIFSSPIKNIDDVTGTFRKELDYLRDKGFSLSKDGLGMVR